MGPARSVCPILYLDTSALVKLYVREEGREEVRRAVLRAGAVAISEVGYVEARSAFARREREGFFSTEGHDREVGRLRRDFGDAYLTRPVTGEVVARAGELARVHALRAYDAVHLATALILREELEETAEEQNREPAEGAGIAAPAMNLMTYDGHLARAAREEGLTYPRRD
ncbi:MAG: type II toxin-antitoxin system VapC family toxin [Actinomycetota bacterium]|nr:type II toxin-antitoxin system VapC family toxin [Actinomycetota bacterium]